jgi:hypothetical protein
MENQQCKSISKEEAYQIIDSIKHRKIIRLTYDDTIGMSDNGQWVRKRMVKRDIKKCRRITLNDQNPVVTMSVYDDDRDYQATFLIPS